MTVAVSSGKNIPVLKLSSLAVTVWPTGSSFVQVIASPTLIVMGSGTYLKLLITALTVPSSVELAGTVVPVVELARTVVSVVELAGTVVSVVELAGIVVSVVELVDSA